VEATSDAHGDQQRISVPSVCGLQETIALNFLFINTDQQRQDTLGCYGSTVAKTPNLDRLAAEGVRFDRAYTTNPVCMPARASWFTGQYPSYHGCWQNGVPLSPNADMIQNHLKAAGYHTALIGKVHLDNVWERNEKHPSYGFDLLLECEGDPYCKDDYFQWLDQQGLYDGYMAQFKEMGHRQGYTRDLPEAKHMNTWITDHVDHYLNARAKDRQPFFLSVGFFDPHHPFDPCEPYASMFEPRDMPMPSFREDEVSGMTPPMQQKREREWPFCSSPVDIRGTIAAYHATIAHVDAAVGQIFGTLEACGLADDTVVIFMSDHGELLGDHGMLHKGAVFYECSIKVPLLFRFPKRIGLNGLSDNGFTSHVDLAPTIAELAGINGPLMAQGSPLFGREGDLRPIPARDAALVEWREKPFQSDEPFQVVRCLVTDDMKIVQYEGCDWGELYDLNSDPSEFKNLWHDSARQGEVNRLRQRLWRFSVENEPCPPRTNIF